MCDKVADDKLNISFTGDHLSMEEMRRVFEKMDGDAQFLASLLEKFKESSDELLTRIRACIAEHDFENLGDFSHALKGEFHMFNAAVPIRITEALERVCRTGCIPQNAGEVAAKLEEEVQHVILTYTLFLEQVTRKEP